MRGCDQAEVAAALQEAFDRGKTVIGPALEISQDGTRPHVMTAPQLWTKHLDNLSPQSNVPQYMKT
jgi:hypothetical protein